MIIIWSWKINKQTSKRNDFQENDAFFPDKYYLIECAYKAYVFMLFFSWETRKNNKKKKPKINLVVLVFWWIGNIIIIKSILSRESFC